MTIKELTIKVKAANQTRTHAERVELLRKANIIGADGYLSEKFFSKETVEQDRATHQPITA